MDIDKTVYVLGAGFSIPAGGTSKDLLISKIFELSEKNEAIFKGDSIAEFKDFLSNTMQIPEELFDCVPLEDIFTPLDRCLIDNISFRNLDIDGIHRIRELVYDLIGKTLKELLKDGDKKYIDDFAEYLVDKASVRKKGGYRFTDPLSVISLNWDILLDDSIKKVIDRKYKNDAVVDYCCYISSLDAEDDSDMPGLEMLGRDGFNVKLLKLHGSFNWLQCPKCQRAYVDYRNKISAHQYSDGVNCRHCGEHFGNGVSNKLQSNLIMPTFLKNLLNPQYKLIWQNAGIELAEAKKIVFIGYSLPVDDFEMRQLLARMVRNDAEIEVVDFGKEDDDNIAEVKKRYEVFFGKRKPKFFYCGAKDYIERYVVKDIIGEADFKNN